MEDPVFRASSRPTSQFHVTNFKISNAVIPLESYLDSRRDSDTVRRSPRTRTHGRDPSRLPCSYCSRRPPVPYLHQLFSLDKWVATIYMPWKCYTAVIVYWISLGTECTVQWATATLTPSFHSFTRWFQRHRSRSSDEISPLNTLLSNILRSNNNSCS